jgi:hypothetical protein
MIPLIQRVPAHIRIFQNRAAYRAAFGKEAPPFDYSQPVKDWIDTREASDPDEEISYTGIRYEANGEPVYDAKRVVELREFRLFPEVAQSINLLPEPLPPQGALTPNQLRMVQRKRPWPLALRDGERIILAPGIGTIPVVDGGTSPAASGCQCGEILAIVQRIAAKVGA